MKIIFAGTPDFAASALAALLDAGYDIPLVLSQPDRPAGRGMTLHASAVKQLALARGIEVFQPLTLKEADTQQRLRELAPDLMIVAAYGLLLPQAILDIPRLGCINIHASLLPRWRGAAPIQRAILAGDSQSGVCIMQMEAGLDTGPVLLSATLPITPEHTARSLHDGLATLGAQLIVDAVARLPLPATAQALSGITYAAKLDNSEAPLDWHLSAERLARQVRAFDPFPGAVATLEGVTFKVWGAQAEAATGQAGQILQVDKHGIVVACGEGALRLTELQKAGGKRLPVAQLLAGTKISAGMHFFLPS